MCVNRTHNVQVSKDFKKIIVCYFLTVVNFVEGKKGMRIIFRKLLFLFILFVMPFVSSNAFAACKRIVFAYAPIASDTTNVVEIVRYYNDSANTWFVDAGCGWEEFTDSVIRVLSARENIVYMLWGGYAQKKAALVDGQKNLVLCAAHPSPLSVYRGFFGCRHFSRANEYLTRLGKTPIEW